MLTKQNQLMCRSYLEMEKVFKIFVYKEGEAPLFHDGPCRSIYSSEGRFIYDLETNTQFRTSDPDIAPVHFLPFSITKMIHYLYEPKSFDLNPVKQIVVDYISVISNKYPNWNRSLGADQFLLCCHDWVRSTLRGLCLNHHTTLANYLLFFPLPFQW